MGVLEINSLSMTSELKFNTESRLRQSAVTSPPTTRYQFVSQWRRAIKRVEEPTSSAVVHSDQNVI